MKTAISKSVNAMTGQEDKDYWERHIKSQRASGINRAAYCRINHVDYDRMSYWIKNNKKLSQASVNVIPILIKPETMIDEAIMNGNRILCTLKLKNGMTLVIQDKEALCLLVKEMM